MQETSEKIPLNSQYLDMMAKSQSLGMQHSQLWHAKHNQLSLKCHSHTPHPIPAQPDDLLISHHATIVGFN